MLHLELYSHLSWSGAACQQEKFSTSARPTKTCLTGKASVMGETAMGPVRPSAR